MCDYVCGCRTGALGAHIGPVTTTRIRATRWLIRSECLGFWVGVWRVYAAIAFWHPAPVDACPIVLARVCTRYRPWLHTHAIVLSLAYTRYRPWPAYLGRLSVLVLHVLGGMDASTRPPCACSDRERLCVFVSATMCHGLSAFVVA